MLWGTGTPWWGQHKDARVEWAQGHQQRAGDSLTRCLQPASLKGQSSMAVLQLSLRWVGMSSRAMLGIPHWLGQGTGYRGHWYWWFWGQRVSVSCGWELVGGQGSPWATSHLDGVEDELLGAVGAGLGALGALGQGVLGQQAPHHAGPALVLTVHTLLGTHALVALGTTAASSPSSCPHQPALPGMGPCCGPHGQAVLPKVSCQAVLPMVPCQAVPTARLCTLHCPHPQAVPLSPGCAPMSHIVPISRLCLP